MYAVGTKVKVKDDVGSFTGMMGTITTGQPIEGFDCKVDIEGIGKPSFKEAELEVVENPHAA